MKKLEVMSGPEDGIVKEVRVGTTVLLGPIEGAVMRLEYDPKLQRAVMLELKDDGVYIENKRVASYEELFQVGQVWMRVLLAAEKEEDNATD